MLKQLDSKRYFSLLFGLLGLSFPLSIASMNIFFYLITLSGIVYFFLSDKYLLRQCSKQLFSNRLYLLVLLWSILILLSTFYSSGENPLMYAKKYMRYIPIGIVSLTIILFMQHKTDVREAFWRGFVIALLLVFTLGVFNKLTGGLTALSQAGYLRELYLPNNYFMTIGYFPHSLFYAVFFAYGINEIIRKQNKFGFLFCAIGLFEVFVVSQQRTGYVTFLVVTIWLVYTLIPSYRKKIAILALLVAFLTTVMVTENKVSHRINNAFNEFSTCFTTITQHRDDVQKLGHDCYSSNGLRMLFAVDAVQQIKQSWLYGHGVGALDVATLDATSDGYKLGRSSNPHNEYLMQGIQLGIIGIGLLLTIFYLAFRYALKADDQLQYFYAGVVLMYIAACCFNSFLLDAMEGTFFAVLLSFIISGLATNPMLSKQTNHLSS